MAAVILTAAACPMPLLAGVPPDVAYFQGKWTMQRKGETDEYTWTVTEDLKGEWLSGVTQSAADRVSTDMWRVNAGVVERYVFLSDGVFIRFTGTWKAGKLSMNGIGNGKALDFRARITITRVSDSKFRSLWERQEPDGKWTVYADETYSK